MKPCNDKPCKQCPFVKGSLKGYLGGWESPLDIHHYVMGEGDFPCHMTMDKPNERQCTGAILYMNKNGKRANRNLRVKGEQERMKGVDTTEIMSTPEFIEYHSSFK